MRTIVIAGVVAGILGGGCAAPHGRSIMLYHGPPPAIPLEEVLAASHERFEAQQGAEAARAASVVVLISTVTVDPLVHVAYRLDSSVHVVHVDEDLKPTFGDEARMPTGWEGEWPAAGVVRPYVSDHAGDWHEVDQIVDAAEALVREQHRLTRLVKPMVRILVGDRLDADRIGSVWLRFRSQQTFSVDISVDGRPVPPVGTVIEEGPWHIFPGLFYLSLRPFLLFDAIFE